MQIVQTLREERVAVAQAAQTLREERVAATLAAQAVREPEAAAEAARKEREAERAAAAQAVREEREAAAEAARKEREAERVAAAQAAREEREAERAEARADSLRREEAIRQDAQLALESQLAAKQFEVDLARGCVRARPLYESCLQKLTDRVLSARLVGARPAALDLSPSGMEAMLLTSPACSAVPLYIAAIGSANGANGQRVLKQARCLHGALCRPLHCTKDVDSPKRISLFDGEHGRERLLAFVAVVLLAGRNPNLYALGSMTLPFYYHSPPSSLAASPAEVLKGPLRLTHVALDFMAEAEAEEEAEGGELQ